MEKKKLTKHDIQALRALQYCEEAFNRNEENKRTDRCYGEGQPLINIVINDDSDYQFFKILLKLNCLTLEENKAIASAIELYELNGMSKVSVDTEEDYEIIDRMLDENSLSKLDDMFKGKKK